MSDVSPDELRLAFVNIVKQIQYLLYNNTDQCAVYVLCTKYGHSVHPGVYSQTTAPWERLISRKMQLDVVNEP